MILSKEEKEKLIQIHNKLGDALQSDELEQIVDLHDEFKLTLQSNLAAWKLIMDKAKKRIKENCKI
jgi:hypothetical protein